MESARYRIDAAGEIPLWQGRQLPGYSNPVAGEWETGVLSRTAGEFKSGRVQEWPWRVGTPADSKVDESESSENWRGSGANGAGSILRGGPVRSLSGGRRRNTTGCPARRAQ